MEEDLTGYEALPPPPVVPAGVQEQIRGYVQELKAWRSEHDSGMKALDDKTFCALTGFKSAAVAQEEYDLAGGDAVFEKVSHRGTPFSEDVLREAYEDGLKVFPKFPDVWGSAYEHVKQEKSKNAPAKDARGRPPRVDPFHCFLLVFSYVHGGVLEFQAPFLPGIRVSQSHFSRLLNSFTPVVASQWAAKYYCRRDLSWLLENAGPDRLMESERSSKHGHDENLLQADIVLAYDGGTVKCEKSRGGREQKQLYDYGKDNQPEVRLIVVTALNGAIVEMNNATGGRASEMTVSQSLGLLERLDAEAAAEGRRVKIHLLLDRGFYFFKREIEGQAWEAVTITVGIPYHVVPPVGRGHKRPKGEKKRRQVEPDEVLVNRQVASERWINEWSVGRLKHCRLFNRLLDLSILHNIDHFFAIAAALCNFGVGIKPV